MSNYYPSLVVERARAISGALVAKGKDEFRKAEEECFVDVRVLVRVRDFLDALGSDR